MMAAALSNLENQQMPAAIRGVAGEMFDTLAPEMSGFSRVALSNLWLFGPLVQRQLEGAGSTSAMLRTTTALTIVNAGNKDNVLPGRAEATVNFRILPATPAKA
jgi:carboxypeptidase PM20D1